MKKLSDSQVKFLKEEFEITDINYEDKERLQNIRLKCFNIETEECMKSLENGTDEASIGEREDMAVSIIYALEMLAISES